MGATQVAQWHGSALGAEFDHSPMAPPIVHPSNGVNHCGRPLGPGTLDPGGYGLSRPGWEFRGLGFRVSLVTIILTPTGSFRGSFKDLATPPTGAADPSKGGR